jgi:hypothetical protein
MQNQSPVRPHKTSRQRGDILSAYKRTELTQREFAARHDIALTTLQRWLRQRESGSPSQGVRFVQVPNLLATPEPVRGSSAAAAYRLHFPRGLVLEVAPGFQAGEVRLLAQLIQAL